MKKKDFECKICKSSVVSCSCKFHRIISLDAFSKEVLYRTNVTAFLPRYFKNL